MDYFNNVFTSFLDLESDNCAVYEGENSWISSKISLSNIQKLPKNSFRIFLN